MLWLLLPFIIAVILGTPISISLALGAFSFILANNLSTDILSVQMYSTTKVFSLMAIPFFIFAGDLMSRTGITSRLMDFAKILVERIRSGLSHVMVVTATIFAGLSGSAVADTAAMGKVLGPHMEKEGYDKNYIGALCASCGILGPVIPPSTMMIIYGATLNESVGKLFMGGVIPGLLIAFFIMLTAYIIGTIKKHPKKEEKGFDFKRLLKGLKDSSLALLMPVIILVGIRGGVFTPTEGGAVAALYAMILGFIVYRTLTVKDVIDSLFTSAITGAVIMLIVAASDPFSWILKIEQIPQQLAALVTGISSNPIIIMLIINLLLLFFGMFVETAAIIVLLGPILAPIAVKVGIDPIHFGVIVVLNLTIGMATPPLGVNLFVAAPIMDTTIERITVAIVPFIAMLLVALLIINIFPQLVLWLPSVTG